MEKERFPVGIIGLGPYGMAFASRLMARDLPLIGYRRSGMDEFVAAGGIAAASPAELVERADVVLDCLPHEEALLTLFDGPFSIMDAVRPDQVIVSLASYTLENKQRFADLVAAQGGRVLDCEVSGTPEMAARGEATIYVSGDAQAAANVAPLIDHLSARHVQLGDFGDATRWKIANGGQA